MYCISVSGAGVNVHASIYKYMYTSHKITAAQNEATFSYYKARRLYFVAVIFTVTIDVYCV